MLLSATISIGLEYDFCRDGTATVTSIGSCTDSHIVIPQFVEGKTVVAIADNAFAGKSEILSVKLPCSVTSIGKKAFAWCRGLELVIANGLLEIGDKAFMGCDCLSDLGLGKRIRKIGSKAFAYCPSLTSAHLPDSIREMGSSVFEGCQNLDTVVLPDCLKVLENGTFYACTNLKSVEFPVNLKYIDEYAFAYCISLGAISISKNTVTNKSAFFESDIRIAS